MSSRIVIPNEVFFAEVERLISEGCDTELQVKGYSMRPFMRSDRTRVRLSPCDTAGLRRGEVVLFRYRGRHVMHRIAKRCGDEFVMVGDGNIGIEERCTSGDIIARATAVISNSGRVLSCDSRLWRTASALWVSLPQFVRRCILGALWRIGVK